MEKSPSWSRAHDWKSCRPLKGLEGSNPSFSATESLETVRFQGFPFLRPASVFAAGKPLGGTKERHLLLADVSLSWQGVTIQILSGRSNSLAFKFAIFLEKHLTGLLAGSAFAPYKRFTTGKTLAQGEFTSPEHFNHRRVERPTGAKPKRKCDLSIQVAFSFGGLEGDRTLDLCDAKRHLNLF